MFVPTTAPSGATSSISRLRADAAHALGDVVRDAPRPGRARCRRAARSSGARVLADEALELATSRRACPRTRAERLDLALDEREQRPHAEQAADERLAAADAAVALQELERLEREHEARAAVEALGLGDEVGERAGAGLELARDAERREREADRDGARVDDRDAAAELGAAARRAELTVAESASERCSESTCS